MSLPNTFPTNWTSHAKPMALFSARFTLQKVVNGQL